MQTQRSTTNIWKWPRSFKQPSPLGVHIQQTFYSTHITSRWIHIQITWRQYKSPHGCDWICRRLNDIDRWTTTGTHWRTIENNARGWRTMEQSTIQLRTVPKSSKMGILCNLLRVQANRRTSNATQLQPISSPKKHTESNHFNTGKNNISGKEKLRTSQSTCR